MVNFIVNGSPPDSQALVKMPAKGGHLDLTDEQIKQIAEEVIEHAVAYKPEQVAKPKHTSKKGFFTKRFGPVVSTAIETNSKKCRDCLYRSPGPSCTPWPGHRRAVMVFDSETPNHLILLCLDESAKPGNQGYALFGGCSWKCRGDQV